MTKVSYNIYYNSLVEKQGIGKLSWNRQNNPKRKYII